MPLNSSTINRNSYAENLNKLILSTNSALEGLKKFNDSLYTNEDNVTATFYNDNSSQPLTVYIPSYYKVVAEVEAVKRAVDSLVSGHGVVELNDGSKRLLNVSPVPKSPSIVTNLKGPENFVLDNNWFFEDFMFPRLKVKLDLTGKIDDDSDRVMISRIILDAGDVRVQDFFRETFTDGETELNYGQLKLRLSNASIRYYEDLQEVNLPLTYETRKGSFLVSSTQIMDGKEWFYLNNISYNIVDQDGNVGGSVNLKKGDLLRYQESVYKIADIRDYDKSVLLTPVLGVSSPGYESEFNIYNTPFQKKEIKVGVGYNEINIIFVKAVNENYNLLSPEWSNGVAFDTNNLPLYGNSELTLPTFYHQYVADFGK